MTWSSALRCLTAPPSWSSVAHMMAFCMLCTAGYVVLLYMFINVITKFCNAFFLFSLFRFSRILLCFILVLFVGCLVLNSKSLSVF